MFIGRAGGCVDDEIVEVAPFYVFENCLIRPFFLGPRQMTASEVEPRRCPIDMTARLGVA